MCVGSPLLVREPTSFQTKEEKDQSGAWRNGTSFSLNDLEALMNVALEAKEWIAAHVLTR